MATVYVVLVWGVEAPTSGTHLRHVRAVRATPSKHSQTLPPSPQTITAVALSAYLSVSYTYEQWYFEVSQVCVQALGLSPARPWRNHVSETQA